MGLEMHELLFRQLKTVQEDLRGMQEQFRELILEEDKHQPRSSKLPRTSERYLYAQHVRSAETCEQAMSQCYICHRNFRFGACFAVLRSQVKDLINWALRSNDGLSYDNDEPDEHCDPMRDICQIQPGDDHYEKRIVERRGFGFKRRTDTMNRLTGTPHESEPDWRFRNVENALKAIRVYRDLTVQHKEEIAQALSATASNWISGSKHYRRGRDIWSEHYRHGRDQQQSINYEVLDDMPPIQRIGCVCVEDATVAMVDAGAVYLERTSKSL